MKVSVGLIFALYSTAFIQFSKTVDSRTLSKSLSTEMEKKYYFPLGVVWSNVDGYYPRLPFSYRVYSPWDAAGSSLVAKKKEINETGKRASKGLERIGEDMARLRRGAAITLTDEMSRLRQTVSGIERVRLGENMARL